MRFARVRTRDGIHYIVVDGETARLMNGDPLGDWKETGKTLPLAECELLAPCVPSKIVAVGLNYADHIDEMKHDDVPDDPVIFIKPDTCALDPGQPIVRPPASERVDYEAELAVVIGRTCRNITAAEADDYILGYTVLNDVTARDLQKKDGQWTRGKGFDTFAPMGPWIETEFDPSRPMRIRSIVNGEIKQDSTTNLMIRQPQALIAFISQVMTLKPYDVIATGTPAGIGPVVRGDTVTIEVEGIGSISNPVVDQE